MDASFKEINDFGYGPLHRAVILDNKREIIRLVSSNYDTSAKDSLGFSALDLAIILQKPALLPYLTGIQSKNATHADSKMQSMLRNKEIKRKNCMDVSNKVTKDLLKTSCSFNEGLNLLGEDIAVDATTSFHLPDQYRLEAKEAIRFPNRWEEKISETTIKPLRRHNADFIEARKEQIKSRAETNRECFESKCSKTNSFDKSQEIQSCYKSGLDSLLNAFNEQANIDMNTDEDHWEIWDLNTSHEENYDQSENSRTFSDSLVDSTNIEGELTHSYQLDLTEANSKQLHVYASSTSFNNSVDLTALNELGREDHKGFSKSFSFTSKKKNASNSEDKGKHSTNLNFGKIKQWLSPLKKSFSEEKLTSPHINKTSSNSNRLESTKVTGVMDNNASKPLVSIDRPDSGYYSPDEKQTYTITFTPECHTDKIANSTSLNTNPLQKGLLALVLGVGLGEEKKTNDVISNVLLPHTVIEHGQFSLGGKSQSFEKSVFGSGENSSADKFNDNYEDSLKKVELNSFCAGEDPDFSYPKSSTPEKFQTETPNIAHTSIGSIVSNERKNGAHVRVLIFDEKNSFDDNKEIQSETCDDKSKLSSGSESDNLSLSNRLGQRNGMFYLEDEDENKVNSLCNSSNKLIEKEDYNVEYLRDSRLDSFELHEKECMNTNSSSASSSPEKLHSLTKHNDGKDIEPFYQQDMGEDRKITLELLNYMPPILERSSEHESDAQKSDVSLLATKGHKHTPDSKNNNFNKNGDESFLDECLEIIIESKNKTGLKCDLHNPVGAVGYLHGHEDYEEVLNNNKEIWKSEKVLETTNSNYHQLSEKKNKEHPLMENYAKHLEKQKDDQLTGKEKEVQKKENESGSVEEKNNNLATLEKWNSDQLLIEKESEFKAVEKHSPTTENSLHKPSLEFEIPLEPYEDRSLNAILKLDESCQAEKNDEEQSSSKNILASHLEILADNSNKKFQKKCLWYDYDKEEINSKDAEQVKEKSITHKIDDCLKDPRSIYETKTECEISGNESFTLKDSEQSFATALSKTISNNQSVNKLLTYDAPLNKELNESNFNSENKLRIGKECLNMTPTTNVKNSFEDNVCEGMEADHSLAKNTILSEDNFREDTDDSLAKSTNECEDANESIFVAENNIGIDNECLNTIPITPATNSFEDIVCKVTEADHSLEKDTVISEDNFREDTDDSLAKSTNECEDANEDNFNSKNKLGIDMEFVNTIPLTDVVNTFKDNFCKVTEADHSLKKNAILSEDNFQEDTDDLIAGGKSSIDGCYSKSSSTVNYSITRRFIQKKPSLVWDNVMIPYEDVEEEYEKEAELDYQTLPKFDELNLLKSKKSESKRIHLGSSADEVYLSPKSLESSRHRDESESTNDYESLAFLTNVRNEIFIKQHFSENLKAKPSIERNISTKVGHPINLVPVRQISFREPNSVDNVDGVLKKIFTKKKVKEPDHFEKFLSDSVATFDIIDDYINPEISLSESLSENVSKPEYLRAKTFEDFAVICFDHDEDNICKAENLKTLSEESFFLEKNNQNGNTGFDKVTFDQRFVEDTHLITSAVKDDGVESWLASIKPSLFSSKEVAQLYRRLSIDYAKVKDNNDVEKARAIYHMLNENHFCDFESVVNYLMEFREDSLELSLSQIKENANALIVFLESVFIGSNILIKDIRFVAELVAKPNKNLYGLLTPRVKLLKTCFIEEMKHFKQHEETEYLIKCFIMICKYFVQLDNSATISMTKDYLLPYVNERNSERFLLSVITYMGLLKTENKFMFVTNDLTASLLLLNIIFKNKAIDSKFNDTLIAFLNISSKRFQFCNQERLELLHSIENAVLPTFVCN